MKAGEKNTTKEWMELTMSVDAVIECPDCGKTLTIEVKKKIKEDLIPIRTPEKTILE